MTREVPDRGNPDTTVIACCHDGIQPHMRSQEPCQSLLEDSVYKRGDSRSLGQNQKTAERQRQQHHWRHPKFFVLEHEQEEFAQDCHLSFIHSFGLLVDMAYLNNAASLTMRASKAVQASGQLSDQATILRL
ncbi:hypothetical protein [Mesorhizobium caraganae]|uniref:hypothetical protein n=1 Tax=Mesorhizobium caraganae TaxID=483206 RepID=UPI003F4F6756